MDLPKTISLLRRRLFGLWILLTVLATRYKYDKVRGLYRIYIPWHGQAWHGCGRGAHESRPRCFRKHTAIVRQPRIEKVYGTSLFALALGVGAVAACVVPWFYCKPKNDGDDEREGTTVREISDALPRSRSNVEDVSSTTMGIQIHGLRGFNFIRLVIPSDCVTSNTSELSASRQTTMENSTLHAFCRENCPPERKRFPIEAVKVQSLRSNSVESANPEASKSVQNLKHPGTFESGESIDSGTNEPRSVANAQFDSESSTSGTIDGGTTNLSSINSGLSSSGMLNSTSSSLNLKGSNECSREITNGMSRETEYAMAVSGRNVVEVSTNVEWLESSNHTGESSMESIPKTCLSQELETTSSTSRSKSMNTLATTEASNLSNCPDESPTESTNATSSSQESTNADAKSQQNAINASRNVVSLESSNHTDESSTETTHRTLTSEESSKVTESSTNPLVCPSMESPIMEQYLDTICETSVSFETPREPLHDQHPSLQDFIDPNEIENARMNRVSFTSIPAKNSKPTRTRFNFVAAKSNSPLDKSPESVKSEPCIDDRGRKSSKYSRYRLALTDGLKTVWRSMKFDRTPRTPRDWNRYESGVESVHSLSAGAKIPAGHSTLNEPRKSNVFEKFAVQQFEANEKLEVPEANLPVMMLEDEPLDLSIRSSLDFRESNEDSLLGRHTQYTCTTGFCDEIFCEFSDFLKIQVTSGGIEEDPTHSGSMDFDGGALKLCPRDENENITLDSPANDVNMKMWNTSRSDEYLKMERRDFDNSKDVNEKGLSQKFKNIFNLRNNISDKISSSGKKEKRRKLIPGIRRDSTQVECRSTKKNHDSGNPTNLVSADIALSSVLGFTTSREEGNLLCTEL